MFSAVTCISLRPYAHAGIGIEGGIDGQVEDRKNNSSDSKNDDDHHDKSNEKHISFLIKAKTNENSTASVYKSRVSLLLVGREDGSVDLFQVRE